MKATWVNSVLCTSVLFSVLSVCSCSSIAPENVWRAIETEDLQALEEFLNQGVDVEGERATDNRLPLMHATLHRKPKVIEFLLENGADVNGTDSVGNTCLIIAVFLGAEDTVKALLEGSADLFRRNIVGEDVLDALEINWRLTNYYANEIYQLGLTQEEIEYGRSKIRPILIAAREHAAREDIWVALSLGRLDLIKDHIKTVDDIATLVTTDGSPILVAASALGHIEIVKYLLQAGADIESRDAHGSTSLFVAAMFGHEEIVKLLLDNNADIFVVNYQGANLNTAFELDWDVTNGIALLIGLRLEESKLKETRTKIKNLVIAHKESLNTNDSDEQD